MAGPAGFEPATYGLEGSADLVLRRSIHAELRALYIYFNIFLSFLSDLRASDPGTTPALKATPISSLGRGA